MMKFTNLKIKLCKEVYFEKKINTSYNDNREHFYI